MSVSHGAVKYQRHDILIRAKESPSSRCFPCYLPSSFREWADWCPELRVSGDEIKWKFNSDGSVNGWGWKFTVYPIMPTTGPQQMLSDRYAYREGAVLRAANLLGHKRPEEGKTWD